MFVGSQVHLDGTTDIFVAPIRTGPDVIEDGEREPEDDAGGQGRRGARTAAAPAPGAGRRAPATLSAISAAP